MSPSVALTLLVLATGAQEPGPSPLLEKSASTRPGLGSSGTIVEIKFRNGTDVRLQDGRFVGRDAAAEQVDALVQSLGATARRTFAQSEEWLRAWRRSGETHRGIELHDLNLFFCIDLPHGGAPDVCDVLNTLESVEIAYPASLPFDPTIPPALLLCLPAMTTPDFTSQQGYAGPAPTGVDAAHANTFSGGRGIGVTIVDCETGWTDDHEDLAHKAQGSFIGYTPAPYPWHHGTAVIGEMIGGDNGFGVIGLCPDADVRLSTHSPVGGTTNIPGSIMNAAAAAQPGDVIVVEIQCFDGPPGPHPCEYAASTFATIQTATANGVHVIAAAGNGDNDLDASAYGGAFLFAVRDSGAIIVGASNGSSLSKAGFSNYGTRLTSHGWGYNVTTAGYGDLHDGGPFQLEYTNSFSGTSSATPIVTGAAVDLIAIHRTAFKSDIDPIFLRDLLRSTGTPQGSGGIIGSRPDLEKAIRALAIPEVEVAGNLTAGGTFQIILRGTPGDVFGLFWSPSLAPQPTYLAPAGYFHLNVASFFPFLPNGVIGASGSTTLQFPIPNLPGLSGFTSHVQGYQIFQTGPGVGSFTNHETFTLL